MDIECIFVMMKNLFNLKIFMNNRFKLTEQIYCRKRQKIWWITVSDKI